MNQYLSYTDYSSFLHHVLKYSRKTSRLLAWNWYGSFMDQAKLWVESNDIFAFKKQ